MRRTLPSLLWELLHSSKPQEPCSGGPLLECSDDCWIGRTGEEVNDELARRLLISGEDSRLQPDLEGTPSRLLLLRSLFPAVLIYTGTPAIATIFALTS